MACVHFLWYLMVEGDIDECVHWWVILKCNISWPAGVSKLPSACLGVVIAICSLPVNYTSLLTLNLASSTYPAMCQLDLLEQPWVAVLHLDIVISGHLDNILFLSSLLHLSIALFQIYLKLFHFLTLSPLITCQLKWNQVLIALKVYINMFQKTVFCDQFHFLILGVFFLLIYLFIFIFWLCWVFVSVRGLFSSCGEQGPLFIAVRGPLTIAASLVAEHRLQTRGLSGCGSRA